MAGLTRWDSDGIDEGAPVPVGLVLGWLDGWAEAEGWPEGCDVGIEDRLGAALGWPEGVAGRGGFIHRGERQRMTMGGWAMGNGGQ